MYDVSAIKNYIMFLKSECGLSITLHPLRNENIIFQSELSLFNIHDNSYCIYFKGCVEAHKGCIEKQERVLKKCSEGSYTGICHAGVLEYVYPIFNGEKNIGFISVSGYKAENSDSYIKRISAKYNLPHESLSKAYDSLKASTPDKDKVDALIYPLCNMLELAYLKTKNELNSEIAFPEKLVRYIKQYHNTLIDSEDICSHFNCSRSYMSLQFNKYTGKTIREYINMLRIEDSKALLKYGKLSVTEIAYSVGYNDSNYFSSLFKQYTGVSPLKYRKESKEKAM